MSNLFREKTFWHSRWSQELFLQRTTLRLFTKFAALAKLRTLFSVVFVRSRIDHESVPKASFFLTIIVTCAQWYCMVIYRAARRDVCRRRTDFSVWSTPTTWTRCNASSCHLFADLLGSAAMNNSHNEWIKNLKLQRCAPSASNCEPWNFKTSWIKNSFQPTWGQNHSLSEVHLYKYYNETKQEHCNSLCSVFASLIFNGIEHTRCAFALHCFVLRKRKLTHRGVWPRRQVVFCRKRALTMQRYRSLSTSVTVFIMADQMFPCSSLQDPIHWNRIPARNDQNSKSDPNTQPMHQYLSTGIASFLTKRLR